MQAAVIIIGVVFFLSLGIVALDRYFVIQEKKKRREQNEQQSEEEETEQKILQQIVTEGVHEEPDQKKRHRRVSEIVSKFFDKELAKRNEENRQVLEKRYKDVIQKKTESENIAWKKYKQVLANKKETEAVIRSIAEGLVVVDAKGDVVMMNPTAERLLGVSKKQKIGESVFKDLKREQIVALAKDSPTEPGNKEIEIISEEDETKKILKSSSAVIEDENGQTVGMVSVLSDITKQKELDKLKSDFVSNVTHELRSPLIAIQKSVDILLNKTTGNVSAEQQKFLSIAEQNIKKLSTLINNLLDLSKLEAGKMGLKLERTSIEKLIEETIESFKAWLETKSITIKRKIGSGLPEANLDPVRISQVLTNLLSNAIKFTPKNGSITIRAALEGDNNLRVSVEDTGIGIEKGALEKIFDKFSQAEQGLGTATSGTGIGLSIVKEVVGLHRGRVWVESEKDHGAKFIFMLPIE